MIIQIDARKCSMLFLVFVICFVANLESLPLDTNLSISKAIISNSKNYNKLVESFRKNWESPLAYLIQRGYIPKEDAKPDKNCQRLIKKMQEEYSEKSKLRGELKLRKEHMHKGKLSHLEKKHIPRQAEALCRMDCKNITELETEPPPKPEQNETKPNVPVLGQMCTTTTAKPKQECEEDDDNATECYEYEVYEDGTRVTSAAPGDKCNEEKPTEAPKCTTEAALEKTTEKATTPKCNPAALIEDQKKPDLSEFSSQSPFKFHFFCPTQHTPLAAAADVQVAPNAEHKEAYELANEIAKNTVAEFQRNNYQVQSPIKHEKQPIVRPKRGRYYKAPASFPPALHWGSSKIPAEWRGELRPLRSEAIKNPNKYQGWHPGPHPTSPSHPTSHSNRNQLQLKSGFKSKLKPSGPSLHNMASKYSSHMGSRLHSPVSTKNYDSSLKDQDSLYKQHLDMHKNDYLYDDDDSEYNPDYLAVNAIYVVNKKGDKTEGGAHNSFPQANKANSLKSNQKSKLRPEAEHKAQNSNAKVNGNAKPNSHNWAELNTNAKSKPNQLKYKPSEGSNNLVGQKAKTQYASASHHPTQTVQESNHLNAQKGKPQYSSPSHHSPQTAEATNNLDSQKSKPQYSSPLHYSSVWKGESTKLGTSSQQWTNYKQNSYDSKLDELMKPLKPYSNEGKFLSTLGVQAKTDFLDATNIGAQNSNNLLKNYNYDVPSKATSTTTADAKEKKPDNTNDLSHEPLLDPTQYNYGKETTSTNDWKGDYHDRNDYKPGEYKYDPNSYPSQAILNLYRYKNMNKNLENFFVPMKQLNEQYEQQQQQQDNAHPKEESAPAASTPNNNSTAAILNNIEKLSSDAEMHSKCLSIIDMAVRNATGSKQISSFSQLHDSTEKPKIQPLLPQPHLEPPQPQPQPLQQPPMQQLRIQQPMQQSPLQPPQQMQMQMQMPMRMQMPMHMPMHPTPQLQIQPQQQPQQQQQRQLPKTIPTQIASYSLHSL